jgi:potassium-transporting ATPase potassium-binding subunit
VAQAPRGGGRLIRRHIRRCIVTAIGWLQIFAFIGVVGVLTRPLGGYLARVYGGENTVLRFLFGPLERGIYRVAGIDPKAEQGWKTYAISFLAFHALGIAGMYAVLRLQQGGCPANC